jgi:hypothetical protein
MTTMTKTEVGIIFKAYDETSRNVDKIGLSLNKLGGSLRTAAAAAGIALSVDTAVRAMKSWVSAAKEADKVQRTFELALGDNANTAGEWADRYAASAGVCEIETRKLLTSQQMFAEELGLTDDQALQTAEGLTRLADDVASFTRGAVTTAEALQKFQLAMGGSYRGLVSLGIKITDTMVKEYALREGWIKEGQEMSRAQQAAATFDLMLDHTSKIQGDLGRSTGTVADEERRLNKEWADTKRVLGEDILPAYKVGVGLVHDFAQGLRAVIEEAGKVPGALSRVGRAVQDTPLLSSALGGMSATGNAYRPGGSMGINIGRPEYRPLSESVDTVPPEMLQRWELMWEDAHRINEEARAADAEAKRLQNPGGEKDTAKEVEKYADDQANAYRRMYNDLDRRTEVSYAGRMDLLREEYQKYSEFVEDKVLLEEWFAEKTRALNIEWIQATGDFFDGFKAGVAEMQDNLQTLGQVGAESAKLMRDSWVSGSWEVIAQMRSAGEVARSVALDFTKLAYQYTMNRALTGLLGGVVGAVGGWKSPGGGQSYGALDTNQFGNYEAMSGFYGYGGARAGGGDVSPGRFYKVGEQGVELFAPGQPGTIIPASGGGSGLSESLLAQLLTEIRGLRQQRMMILDRRNGLTRDEVAGVIIDDLDHGGLLSQRLG